MTTTESTIDDRLTVQRLLLGGDLRAIRARYNLTAGALAAQLGVERSAVSRWEAGNRAPRPRALLRLVVVLEQMRAQDGGAP
jgi:DNA-binding transcriptional regulator YiaG